MKQQQRTPASSTPWRRVLEVFGAFLKLGVTSFGGPIAHLGYFRSEFVERRRWLDDESYSDLVALCQFLPGPASSQVGMAIGLSRAGWWGALAAWTGFTAPSAVALILFALGVAKSERIAQSGAIHGLKLVAVAVVAQAVWGMGKSLCTDRRRVAVAVVSAFLVWTVPSAFGQVLAIAGGAVVGRWALSAPKLHVAGGLDVRIGRAAGAVMLALFVGLLIALPLLARVVGGQALPAFAAFYKDGALVFGGGHVVLPLLRDSVVPIGWVSDNVFLAGYGAAQAVPGPLFSFAAFLGASMAAPLGGWAGGLLMLTAIFLPAFLLLAGALPYWESLRQNTAVQRAMGGVNAAVVGLLAAALYDPVWTGSVHTLADVALAGGAFGLLVVARTPPVLIVCLAALAGLVFNLG
jgi:chromate transporter